MPRYATLIDSKLEQAEKDLKAGRNSLAVKGWREAIQVADDDESLPFSQSLFLRDQVSNFLIRVGNLKEASELDDEIEGTLDKIDDKDDREALSVGVQERRTSRRSSSRKAGGALNQAGKDMSVFKALRSNLVPARLPNDQSHLQLIDVSHESQKSKSLSVRENYQRVVPAPSLKYPQPQPDIEVWPGSTEGREDVRRSVERPVQVDKQPLTRTVARLSYFQGSDLETP